MEEDKFIKKLIEKTFYTMSKPKLFVTPHVVKEREISEEYLQSLRSRFVVHTVNADDTCKEEFLAHVEGSFAILASAFDVIDEEVLKAAGDDLQIITVAAAGYDKVDRKALKKYGVRLGAAGSALTPAASEMALVLLLAASRNLVQLIQAYKRNPTENYQPKPPCMGLENSIIGIVGAGRIGLSVARQVYQFSISQLHYYNRSENPAMADLGAEKCSLENLAVRCDYMVVALSFNKQTDRIIGKKIFSLMKPTAQIVNIGRGGVIDHDALVEALQQGEIGGAALDVTQLEPLPADHPLFQLDNVIISPHVGGLTNAVQKNSVDQCIKNIVAVLEGTQMPEEVILRDD